MRKLVKVAPKGVAKNPVARAVRARVLLSACTEVLLKVYTLEDRECARSWLYATYTVLLVTLFVLEDRGDGDSPDARVIAGTLSALRQVGEAGYRWKRIHAPAVHAGLTRMLELYPTLTAQELHLAWARANA